MILFFPLVFPRDPSTLFLSREHVIGDRWISSPLPLLANFSGLFCPFSKKKGFQPAIPGIPGGIFSPFLPSCGEGTLPGNDNPITGSKYKIQLDFWLPLILSPVQLLLFEPLLT
ncbi:MAG: hypothetical protein ACFFD4_02330 [Candidatus Odinarchaeota archaeon]